MTTLIQLLVVLVIAGICGVIAEWIVGFSPGGFAVSIVVGVIGAFVGGWVARQIPGAPQFFAVSQLGFGTGVLPDFDIVWAIVGSILLLFVISLLRGGRRRRRRL